LAFAGRFPSTDSQTMNFDPVDNLMGEAVERGVFPGAVILVAARGAIKFLDAYGRTNIFTRRAAVTDTVFDLASLTKPLATTPAVMMLMQGGQLELDQPIGSRLTWLEGTPVAAVTVQALLGHSAGLPAYRPFYAQLPAAPGFAERLAELKQALAAIVPERPVGGRVLYSDLGFMLLGFLVETVAGCRLDRFLAGNLYAPLGITATAEPRLCFVDLENPVAFEYPAATEICRWRGRLLEGVVHDDNAYWMGGIAGHAGLFGDALGVFQVAQSLMAAYNGSDEGAPFQGSWARRFLSREGPGRRALGFDVPSETGASCGRHFSSRTVGHLGFTGTSLWMDLNRAVIVVLLTNRVHPSRSNERIRDFRPRLHDAVMRAVLNIRRWD
jgi:CubicO group peptidase (beta-lactamase class C family)